MLSCAYVHKWMGFGIEEAVWWAEYSHFLGKIADFLGSSKAQFWCLSINDEMMSYFQIKLPWNFTLSFNEMLFLPIFVEKILLKYLQNLHMVLRATFCKSQTSANTKQLNLFLFSPVLTS